MGLVGRVKSAPLDCTQGIPALSPAHARSHRYISGTETKAGGSASFDNGALCWQGLTCEFLCVILGPCRWTRR